MLEELSTTFISVEQSLCQNGVIRMMLTKKIENLFRPTTEDGFRSQRALAQYIGLDCKLNVCAGV